MRYIGSNHVIVCICILILIHIQGIHDACHRDSFCRTSVTYVNSKVLLTRRRLKSMKRHYNQQISIDMQSLTVRLVRSYSHASGIELTMYIMLYVVL